MNYTDKFFKNEDGVETIEFIGLVAVAAALIVVIANIGTTMKNRAETEKEKMDDALSGLNFGGSDGGSDDV